MQVLIDVASGRVLQYGTGLVATKAGQEVRELADGQVPKLSESGTKVLGGNGQITVSARVPSPGEVKAQQAIDADLASRQALATQLAADAALLGNPAQELTPEALRAILGRLVAIGLVAARTMDRRGA